ncbi:MAG: 3'(2'),5'-bisphosphate nucleotidase CysQ [Holosporales bacterium]
MSHDFTAYLAALLPVTEQAGAAIMRYYRMPIDVHRKDDNSPTTIADAAAEEIILKALSALTPDIPVVAEEAVAEGRIPVLPDNATFWLVDPLDGTKEFLKQTDQFTVNIGLIVNGVPVFGIVGAPALGVLYYGYPGFCAVRRGEDEVVLPRRTAATPPYRVVTSKSHADAGDIKELLGDIPIKSMVPAGSSLKFCLVADGSADFYPRRGTTMEWDTAAGDAVVRAAGAVVLGLDGQPLQYQKPEFRNSGFVVRVV